MAQTAKPTDPEPKQPEVWDEALMNAEEAEVLTRTKAQTPVPDGPGVTREHRNAWYAGKLELLKRLGDARILRDPALFRKTLIELEQFTLQTYAIFQQDRQAAMCEHGVLRSSCVECDRRAYAIYMAREGGPR